MRVVFFTWQAGRKTQASGKPVAPGVDVLVWQFATRSPVTVPGVWKIRAVHRASVSVRLFRPWGFRKILVQPWLLVLLDFSFFFSMMTMTVNPHHQYFQLEAMAALPRFQAMTGGVDWNDLSEPLETSISPIMSVAGVPRGWGSGWDAWWIGCHWPRFELKIDGPMVCMYDAEVFALYIAFAVRAGGTGTIWVEDPELFCLSLLVISFFPSHVRFYHISLAFQEYPHYDFPRTFQGLFLSPIWTDPPLGTARDSPPDFRPYGFWIHLGPVNIGCHMLQSIYPLLRKQLFIWHSLRNPLLTIGIPLSFSQTEPHSYCEISGLNHNFLLHKIQFSARFSDLEVLAMMNVVTGVFVESALGSAREDQKHWPKMGEPYDYDICVDNVSIKIWIDWNSLD